MFSKSLFKQSCKANGIMWIIITAAVCFMLCCVMLIAGNGSIDETKVSIETGVVQSTVISQTQTTALNDYEMTTQMLEKLDKKFAENINEQFVADPDSSVSVSTAVNAYMAALADVLGPKFSQMDFSGGYVEQYVRDGYVDKYIAQLKKHDEYDSYVSTLKSKYPTLDISDKTAIRDCAIKNITNEFGSATLVVINPNGLADSYYEKEDADQVYRVHSYQTLLMKEFATKPLVFDPDDPVWVKNRNEYAMYNSSVFLANYITSEEFIDEQIKTLDKYGITRGMYCNEFGFGDYAFVRDDIIRDALVQYRGRLEHRIKDAKLDSLVSVDEQAKKVAEIKEQLLGEMSLSILDHLPRQISDAVKEIGAADLYGVLVGSIFFKMAGLLLPIIYMIMTANALIAGQIDSGSMAYILSSATKRREVTFTQAMYLVCSLFAMFICTYLSSIVCFAIVSSKVTTELTYAKLTLINIGAFLVMFAMSGISFLASCYFNRSKHSMAMGGGLNMFFLVATMLGLFGSPVLPSIIRMSALNAFNYVSIISLFDVVSILDGTVAYVWKWAILVLIGIVCYICGAIKFKKKDLPL